MSGFAEKGKRREEGRTSVILLALNPPLPTSALVLASRRATKWRRWKAAWTLLIFILLDGERVLGDFDLVGLGQSEGRR